jgi:putative aldouronate transport system substrate-binding protein
VLPSEILARKRASRRTIAKGAAASLAVAAAAPRISFAQDASPEASPAGDIVPSGVEGVPDLYITYPAPQKSYEGVPGKGGEVRAFTIGYQAPPVPHDDNQYWQELEARLGVTWQIDIAPQPNYGEKSAAYLAGGDLPDLFYLNPGQNATQQYQAMAQGAFLDLTPYLTGDSLQQFQNLKNYPQYMWDNNTFQGKIIAVPNPTGRAASDPFYRLDWAETVGISPENPDELAKLLAAFSSGDPDGDGSANTWGLGRFGSGWLGWDSTIAYRMYKLPNNWRLNDDGTLTHQIETDEFKEAIAYLADLHAQGAYHPDAASMTFSDAQNNFIGGSIGLHTEGTGSFFGSNSVGDRQRQANPDARIQNVPNVAVDGGPGVSHNRSGAFGMVAIPASITDEERILELLHILDYLGAPFGTEEREFLSSGVEGVHYERNEDGVPVTNDKLIQERGDLVYLMGPQPYLYSLEYADDMRVLQEILKTAVINGIDDPTLILYSETNIAQGPVLNQLGMDSMTPIVTGRESIDGIQAAIDQWRSQGGDQIRNEYQEALQQQG